MEREPMNDEQLDRLLKAAAREWRVAPPAPREAIWDQIEAEAFRPSWRNRTPGWGLVGMAAAASLIFGIALGRTSAPGTATIAALHDSLNAVTEVTTVAATPFERRTTELLSRTAMLLSAIPDVGLPPGPSYEIARQGGELLVTTRILLDSPLGADPKMRALLEDLELVLAQVARLQTEGSRDIGLIHDAMDRNDIVPRLRSAVIGQNIELN